jgi:hypothetical protein
MSPKHRPDCASLLFCLVCLASLAGCATLPYQHGSESGYFVSRRLAEVQGVSIVRGRPMPVLDTAGWIVGIPSKILLWNSRIDNHHISPETEAAIAEYLAANELTTVKVRLNQYAPLDEWRRLTQNDAVGAPWRYTLGALSVAGDAVFPGRLFGGSHYNPFTNTLHLYSDVPAEALHEGGHAKDFARRQYKGTYAAIYLLPFVPLYHEAIATSDALSYVHEHASTDEEQAAYELLYPAYGTYAGNGLGHAFPGPTIVPYLAGVLAGHAVGRWQGQHLPPRDETITSELPAEPFATLETEAPSEASFTFDEALDPPTTP